MMMMIIILIKYQNTEVLEGDTGEVDGHESDNEPIQREDYETIIEKIASREAG